MRRHADKGETNVIEVELEVRMHRLCRAAPADPIPTSMVPSPHSQIAAVAPWGSTPNQCIELLQSAGVFLPPVFSPSKYVMDGINLHMHT